MNINCLIYSFSLRYVLCIILLVVPLPGNTANCFSDSPSVVNGELVIEPVKVRQLTHNEQNIVRSILKSLSGEWNGISSGYLCYGTKQKPRTKPDNYTIKAKGKEGSSNAVIKAELYDTNKKSTHNEMLRLILNGSLLRVDAHSSVGDIDVKSITPNSITFLQQHRTLAASGGSIFREIVRSITVYDATLNINHKVYTQGVLSSESTWSLSRTK